MLHSADWTGPMSINLLRLAGKSSVSATSLTKDESKFADPLSRRGTFTIPSVSLDLDLVLLKDLAGDGSIEAPAGGVP